MSRGTIVTASDTNVRSDSHVVTRETTVTVSDTTDVRLETHAVTDRRGHRADVLRMMDYFC